MTEEPDRAAAEQPRRWTLDGDVYTCHDHKQSFTMKEQPEGCTGCNTDPGPAAKAEAVTLLPPAPLGCLSSTELERDANVVRMRHDAICGELAELAKDLSTEMLSISKSTVKAEPYYEQYAQLAETRIRVLAELRKQSDLQLKANRRAGDYAIRREDDYIVDEREKRLLAHGGGGPH